MSNAMWGGQPGIVDKQRPEPLWYQVEEAVRNRIASGEWEAGERIPSEAELGEAYGVSRITIRRAIGNLVSSGLLERDHGRGTFVRNPMLVTGARGLSSFTQEMGDIGLKPGSRTLSQSIVPAADGHVAESLAVEPGTPLVRIRRIRTGDGAPIGVQTTRIIASRTPGLEHADLESRSLYEYLAEHYDLRPEVAHEIYRVRNIEGKEAELLGVPVGACGFEVERLTLEASNPFELTTSTMRGDRYEIRSTLRPST